MQVPFTLQDEDISEEWDCSQNVWDKQHNSCDIPQALPDEEIDEILALQVIPNPLPLPSLPLATPFLTVSTSHQ